MQVGIFDGKIRGMMLRAHTPCTVTPTGNFDVYGQEQPGIPYASKCAVVKIQSRDEPSSVRTDSSGSRGYADETKIQARLLFYPDTPLKRGDKVELLGMTIRIIEIMPRIDIHGRLDHLQVDGVMWA